MIPALEFQGVSILFAPDDRARRQLPAARAALAAGATREAISKQHGVVAGVVDANLRIEAAQISVLMGLSGSGKSTLLRAANGLNRVDSGKVLLKDGETQVDVAHCSEATLRRLRRQRLAMVFQQFGLLPWRSVRANVGFGLELRGESAARRRTLVDEKLELVGLAQWAERPVGELSGGMQQRVGLARAFATDADVLLMDEPFSALDPLIRSRLQDELLALQARVRKTIVFVTHDFDEAVRIGNQISIMEGGRIVQTGTPADIVSRPSNEYVAAFVAHLNPLKMLTARLVMRAATDAEIGAGAGAGNLAAALVPGDSLQNVIARHHASGAPVLVAEDGRLVGVCGAQEIVAALGRASAANPAAQATATVPDAT